MPHEQFDPPIDLDKLSDNALTAARSGNMGAARSFVDQIRGQDEGMARAVDLSINAVPENESFSEVNSVVDLDPRPFDESYRIQIQEREKFQTLRWLNEFSEKQDAEPQELPDVEDTAGRPPDEPAPARTTGEIAIAAASDVAKGITEAPVQAVGGAADAINAMLSGVRDVSNFVQENIKEATGVDLGGIQLTDEEGNFDPRLVSTEEAAALRGPQVPTTAEGESVTGGAVRGISQFLTGFATGAKTIGGVNTVGRAVGAGIFADLAAFDGNEGRLSDLIQEFPSLENPITEFLATDEDDSEITGRLKNVVEGLGGDVVFAGLLKALRTMKEARKLKPEGQTFKEAAKLAELQSRGAPFPTLREGSDLSPITGNPDAPAFEIKAMDTGVPDDITARALTPDGVSRTAVGDREVAINFARINTTDDIKGVIADMADAFAGDIAEGQRGVRSNATTIEAAGDQNAWNLISERRSGESLNAEQTFAVRTLWAASAENLSSLAKAAVETPTSENLFAFRRAFAMHSAIQKEALAVRTETARALQQWSIPAGGSKEQLRDIENLINQFGGTEVSENLARRVAALADEGNQGAVDHMARNGALAATTDAVWTTWLSGLLTGVTTHLVNVMSNASVSLMAAVERGAAAGIGDVLGGVDRVRIGEGSAFLHGMVNSNREAWANAWESMKTGETGFGVKKIETQRANAVSSEMLGNTRSEAFNAVINSNGISRGIDALGSLVQIPFRALGAGDEFFKTINYRMELHARAFRQASKDVESGSIPREEFKSRLVDLMENPAESVRLDASEFAAYNTFTQRPGETVTAIKQLAAKVPFGKYIVPFINTPANIFKFTFERTPFAPMSARIRADIASGGSRRDLALARIGLGSTMMLTAFDLSTNGHVTGSGPEDWREKQALRRQGWQPYSIRFGDRFFAYNRLDPLGMLLGLGADMGEYSANSDDEPTSEYEEVAMQSILVAAENATSKTYLSSFSQLVGAINDPQRRGNAYFERFAGSFVPTIVGQAARLTDPHMKHTTSIMSRIKSRLPGMSKDIPNRHDLWGRPITFQSGLGPVYDAFSPVYSSEFDPEPADSEFVSIGYFPGPPSKTLGVRPAPQANSVSISLRNSPKEYQRLVVLSGGTSAKETGRPVTKKGRPDARSRRLDSYGDMNALEYVNSVVTGKAEASAQYDIMNADEKKDFLSRILSDYRAGARVKLLEEFPDLVEFARGK